ncbi:hypothetical protein FOA52_007065 [Chlamydomonas sp. UWO 241]|nr:hypothetical protein FOA52_007065 [Chlamydomonas sp. UWO 241]
MTATSSTQRGKATSAPQRAAILAKIEALEALNPHRAPVDSGLVSGTWALLYQAPLDEARAVTDKSGTTEGPFLATLQPISRGLVRTRANLQRIDLPGGSVENLAEFALAGGLVNGSLNIVGTGAPMTPEEPGQAVTRVYVEFVEFVLRLGPSIKFTVPLGWVNARGWVETTYVDEDLRVGRGDKGSVFVAARLRPERWPA